MVDDATLAPKHAIEVADQPVDGNINQFVRSVEFESCDGIADMARIKLDNPNSIVSDAKMFQPGNEMNVYMGYGKEVSLTHIGRVVIITNAPSYPEEDIETITVTGYTKDVKMMDNSPDDKVNGKVSKGRVWKASDYREIILEISDRYGFATDIDATPAVEKNIIQKTGVTDYDMVQGLANLAGYVFWVDGAADGTWTLHFKRPGADFDQEKKYTFKYGDGDLSSLLSFRPELLIKDAKTKISVISKDRRTGRVIKTDVEEESDQSPDVSADGDATGTVDGEYTSASDIKLFFGDFSFDVVSHRHFESEADLIHWAQQWFRRAREQFIMSQGKIIGIEDVMARQKHMIEGVSLAYEGEYYFSKVKHMMNDSGYSCNFAARKVVP